MRIKWRLAKDTYTPRDVSADVLRQSDIVDIQGYFTHCAACVTARSLRAADLPLDPTVIDSVHKLLGLNVSVAEILADNIRLCDDSFGGNTVTSNTRILLNHQVNWSHIYVCVCV